MLTEGQVQGGVAQGIGQAMLEHTVYDPESGQLLSGSFMDYALPRADDLPAFDIGWSSGRPTANPLGVKGSGQAGCIAAPQTMMAAVLDALGPAGVQASTCRRRQKGSGAPCSRRIRLRAQTGGATDADGVTETPSWSTYRCKFAQ